MKKKEKTQTQKGEFAPEIQPVLPLQEYQIQSRKTKTIKMTTNFQLSDNIFMQDTHTT